MRTFAGGLIQLASGDYSVPKEFASDLSVVGIQGMCACVSFMRTDTCACACVCMCICVYICVYVYISAYCSLEFLWRWHVLHVA